MGADDGAIVDSLRVRGVEGLRMADASVLPRLVSGNTNAVSMLIGERCADFMLMHEGPTCTTAHARPYDSPVPALSRA
ncbi:hypothetical protein GI374_12760 [Paracoccus sp. S-4012]|uniref:GMC oxidoreductase n=1 Tax=Paracoccus sp. S-4012 TaxID=2665648 RepID=UPI0012AF0EE6|nr:hypothetical protein [Paracoccus sp. S-4012]